MPCRHSAPIKGAPAMKNILLLVHDDDGQEARLSAALAVRTALDGHLVCLDVIVTSDGFYRMGGGPIGMLVLEERQKEERHNKAAVHARLVADNIPFSWNDSVGELDTILIDAAGLADLVVLNSYLSDDIADPDMAAKIRAILRRVSTPILAVPRHLKVFDARGKAIVLWDGSPDAEAALRAAVPLLARASEVRVLYADDGSLGASLHDATSYLLHQNIIAHAVRHEITGNDAAVSIEHYLQRHEPAYVVMGAFGHARVHDVFFGSVTRHLLMASSVPLLLARRA